MADNDLSFQIGIEADSANRALDTLTANLEKLGSRLNNLMSGATIASFSEVENAFRGISEAIEGIDDNKLSKAARAMNEFARATNRVGTATKNLNYSKATIAADKYNASIQKIAQNLVPAGFEANQRQLSNITNALVKNAKMANDAYLTTRKFPEHELKSGYQDLNEVVSKNITYVGDSTKENYAYIQSLKQVLDYVRKTHSILAPQGARAEFGDNESFNSAKAAIGLTKVTENAHRAKISIEELVAEMESVGLRTINLSDNEIDNFKRFAEYIANARMEVRNFEEAAVGGLSNSEHYAKSLEGSLLEATMATNEMEEGVRNYADFGVAGNYLDNITKSLDQLGNAQFPDVNNINNLATALSKLGSTNVSKVATTLPQVTGALTRMISSLNQLGALQFDAGSLSGVISAIAELGKTYPGNAAENLPVITENVRTLISSLNQLGSLKFDASTLTPFIEAISRLGSASIGRSVERLPLLATGLSELIVTLNKAPRVNAEVIQLVEGLGRLSGVGNNVSAVSNRMGSSFNRLLPAINRTNKGIKGLAASFGKFYANFWLIIRGLKGLWSAIESAMSFVEVYNYFEEGLGQVADRAVDDWSEVGYDSAEAYYNSFKERSLELTEKMSGYTVGADGSLMSTGAVSLGLDPEEVLNYQAQFAQLASSMGVSSENALKLSSALTRIGADIASVKNEEFTDTWDSMSSALVGMSRAVDDYGINIRAAAMNEKLLDLGINATVNDLSQADKAMLRTIMILDESKYAWADLAETLQSPENAIRRLRAAWASMCRTLGSLFIGVIQKIIPYIIALTNALNTLFQYIAKLLGISLSGITASAVGGIGALNDSIGETEEAIDGASDSAKQLKGNLLGIDELNVINDKENSGGTGGVGSGAGGMLDGALDDILSDYDSIWNDAFNNLSDTVSGLLDKLIDFVKRGDWFGLGKAIGDKITEALNSINWDVIYEGARKFGRGLADFLNGLISPDLFSAVGKTVASALNTALYAALSFGEEFNWTSLGNSIAAGINTFFETFDFASAGKMVNTFAKGLLDVFIAAVGKINWKKIGRQIGKFLAEIDWIGIAKKVMKAIGEAFSGLSDLFAGLFEEAPFETLTLSIIGLGIALGNVAPIINTLISNFTGFLRTITTVDGKLTGISKGVLGVAAGFAEFSLISSSLKDIMLGVDNLTQSIGSLVAGLGIGAAAFTALFGFPAGLIITGIVGVISALKGIKDANDEVCQGIINNSIADALANGGTPISVVKEQYIDAFQGITDEYEVLNTKFDEIDAISVDIKDATESIGYLSIAIENSAGDVEENIDKIIAQFDRLVEDTQQKFELESEAIMQGLSGITGEYAEELGVDIDGVIAELYDIDEAAVSTMEDIMAQLDSLKAAYDEGNITQEEFSSQLLELYKNLNQITGVTNESTEALTSFEDSIEKIDFSEYINVDDLEGSADALRNQAEQVAAAYTQSRETIIASYDEYFATLQNKIDVGELVGVDATAAQEMIDNQDEILNAALSSLDSIYQDYSTKMQNSIDEAFTGYVIDLSNQDAPILVGKERFVAEGIQSFKENIYDPIQEGVGQSGLDFQISIESQDIFSAADALLQISEDATSANIALSLLGGSGAGLSTLATNALDASAETTIYNQILETANTKLKTLGTTATTTNAEIVTGTNTATQTIQTYETTVEAVNTATQSNIATTQEAIQADELFSTSVDGVSGSMQIMADKLYAPVGISERLNQSFVQLNSTFDGTSEKTKGGLGFNELSKSVTDFSTNNVGFTNTLMGLNTELDNSTLKTASVSEKFGKTSLDLLLLQQNATLVQTTMNGLNLSLTALEQNALLGLTTLTTQFTSISTQIATTLTEVIDVAFANTFLNIQTGLQGLLEWYNTNIAVMWTADYWNEALAEVPTAFETVFMGVANVIVGIMNQLIEKINTSMHATWDAVEINGQEVMSAGEAQLFKLKPIEGFAVGGFPNVGDLFFANEQGPELIGTMNGKSAVASNGEITGIRQAIYDATVSIIGEMRSENTDVNVILEGDAKGLFKQVRNEANRFKKSTGINAFA